MNANTRGLRYFLSILISTLLLGAGLAGCADPGLSNQPSEMTDDPAKAESLPLNQPGLDETGLSDSQTVKFIEFMQGETYLPTPVNEKPSVWVAGSEEEAQAFLEGMEDELLQSASGVDFSQYLVLALFRGQVPSSGYSLAVQQIITAAGEVRIEVQLMDPVPGQNVSPVIAYPYQVILLPKDSLSLENTMTWSVYDQSGSLLAQTSYPFTGDTKPAPPSSKSQVPFESLAQGESYTAGVENPTMIIVESAEASTRFRDWITEESVLEQLAKADYVNYWVVAVFRGQMPSSNYSITIEEIRLADGEVQLIAALGDPAPGQMSATVITYPYHIIMIPRSGLAMEAEMTWALYDQQGALLARAK